MFTMFRTAYTGLFVHVNIFFQFSIFIEIICIREILVIAAISACYRSENNVNIKFSHFIVFK